MSLLWIFSDILFMIYEYKRNSRISFIFSIIFDNNDLQIIYSKKVDKEYKIRKKKKKKKCVFWQKKDIW